MGTNILVSKEDVLRRLDRPRHQPEDFGRRGKGYRGVPVRGLQSGRKRAGIRAAISGAKR